MLNVLYITKSRVLLFHTSALTKCVQSTRTRLLLTAVKLYRIIFIMIVNILLKILHYKNICKIC